MMGGPGMGGPGMGGPGMGGPGMGGPGMGGPGMPGPGMGGPGAMGLMPGMGGPGMGPGMPGPGGPHGALPMLMGTWVLADNEDVELRVEGEPPFVAVVFEYKQAGGVEQIPATEPRLHGNHFTCSVHPPGDEPARLSLFVDGDLLVGTAHEEGEDEPEAIYFERTSHGPGVGTPARPGMPGMGRVPRQPRDLRHPLMGIWEGALGEDDEVTMRLSLLPDRTPRLYLTLPEEGEIQAHVRDVEWLDRGIRFIARHPERPGDAGRVELRLRAGRLVGESMDLDDPNVRFPLEFTRVRARPR
jgi:hypothetical protein